MDIQAILPATEATFFILLNLTPQPKHGYAIMKDVRALSGDRVRKSTGTLSSALKRSLERGRIERQADPIFNGNGCEPKAYPLTDLGRGILEEEVDRLDNLVAPAHLRLIGDLR